MKNSGFSLIEVMLVVGVIMVVSSILIVSQKGRQNTLAIAAAESMNMRLIEEAKEKYRQNNPRATTIPAQELLQLLNNQLPPLAWKHLSSQYPNYLSYPNALSLTNIITSPVNGDPKYEPAIQPLIANGYNDLFGIFHQGQYSFIPESSTVNTENITYFTEFSPPRNTPPPPISGQGNISVIYVAP